jgi:hypothetical protein
MSFMTLVVFSSILFTFGFVIYHEMMWINMNTNSVNDINNKTVQLNWKQNQSFNNDSIMILVYFAIIGGIVAPNAPQID